MIWHRNVVQRLRASQLFNSVNLIGAKVRATVDERRFLEIHYDPTSRSYSYAFIDVGLSYPGDKRLFGWDGYPHEGVAEIEQLESYPPHFHRRAKDGSWTFEASPMHGDVAHEIDTVIAAVGDHLHS